MRVGIKSLPDVLYKESEMKKDLSSLKAITEASGLPEIYYFLKKELVSYFNTETNKIWGYCKKVACKHLVLFSDIYTTTGGATTETITGLWGVTAASKVQVTMHTEGATPVTIKRAWAGDKQISIEFSADPGDDHKVNWSVNK